MKIERIEYACGSPYSGIDVSRGNLRGHGDTIMAFATNGHRASLFVDVGPGAEPGVKAPGSAWDAPAVMDRLAPEPLTWRSTVREALDGREWAFEVDVAALRPALEAVCTRSAPGHALALAAHRAQHKAAVARVRQLEEKRKALPRSEKWKLRAAIERAEEDRARAFVDEPAQWPPSVKIEPWDDGAIMISRASYALEIPLESALDTFVVPVRQMPTAPGGQRFGLGPKKAFGMNAQFILDALAHYDRDVRFAGAGPTDPLVLQPCYDPPTVYDLIMPIRL